MKFLFSLLISLLCFSSSAQKNYTLNTAKSTLSWTARNTVSGKYIGALRFQSGTIQLEGDKVLTAKVIAAMKSLTAENKELQNHLRAEDFFDVDQQPLAHFKMSNQPQIVADSIMAEGSMTIIGESVPLRHPLLLIRSENKIVVKGKIKIDRTAFGIYHNSSNFMQRMKEKVIAEEFEIDFTLLFD